MRIRYFTPTELSNLLIKDALPADIDHQECIGICSIADFVDFSEVQKKIESKLTTTTMEDRFLQVCDDRSTSYGMIGVAELDATTLIEAMFEDSGGFWKKAVSSEIPPIHSIRILSLRPTISSWWGYDVFDEMDLIMSHRHSIDGLGERRV